MRINVFSGKQLVFLFFPLIFLYVTEMPKLGSLPLSPVFLFLGTYILYTMVNPSNYMRTLKEETGIIFWLLVLIWFYRYIAPILFSSGDFLDMQLFELIGVFLE